MAVNIHEAKTNFSKLIERVLQGEEITIAKGGRPVLPIHLRHTLRVFSLPTVHRDPFDRLLIAQALVEGLTVLSGDAQFAAYPVATVW